MRVLLPVAVVLILLVGAACGGDSGDSRLRTERWIEDADEICEDENDALGELEPPKIDPFDESLTPAQLDEIAVYLERSLALQNEMTGRLDDLGLPANDPGEIEDVLEQRERGQAAVENAIAAARNGDGERFVIRYRQAVTEYSKASQGAYEFGLEECGQ
ncbi:MAG: hypothetical protein ACRDY6_21665 [Acidimicrobiia bacterium]